jgi:hypothetical protein
LKELDVASEADVPAPSDAVDEVTLLEADTTRLIGSTRVIARVRPNRVVGDDAGAERSHR